MFNKQGTLKSQKQKLKSYSPKLVEKSKVFIDGLVDKVQDKSREYKIKYYEKIDEKLNEIQTKMSKKVQSKSQKMKFVFHTLWYMEDYIEYKKSKLENQKKVNDEVFDSVKKDINKKNSKVKKNKVSNERNITNEEFEKAVKNVNKRVIKKYIHHKEKYPKDYKSVRKVKLVLDKKYILYNTSFAGN